MPRYWVIAAVESNPPELFEKVWRFDLERGCISIGWHELGDVSALTKTQLSEKVASTYPNKRPQSRSLITNMIWAFFNEIGLGDIILARRGRKVLAGVGIVTNSAIYTEACVSHETIPDHTHKFSLAVRWESAPRGRQFPFIAFPMHTVAEFTEAQYHSALELTSPTVDPAIVPEPVVDEAVFVLEKYLEEFIVGNFDAIFQGQFKIFIDSDGHNGQQYTTDIGPIDILAFEPSSNAFVVIELKRNHSSDQVVGQILRYMGWIKQNLCKPGQLVKGLVICRSADPKLIFALSMSANVDVRYYSVSFKLSETC